MRLPHDALLFRAPRRQEQAQNENGDEGGNGHDAPQEPARNHAGLVPLDGSERLLNHLRSGQFEDFRRWHAPAGIRAFRDREEFRVDGTGHKIVTETPVPRSSARSASEKLVT